MWYLESVLLFGFFLIVIEIFFSGNDRRIKLDAENTFDFLGAKINYRILGKGPPVILVHGSMVYDPWGGFEKLLAEKYTVYWIDLPGFGGSDIVRSRLHNTDLFSECLSKFVQILGLERATVISLSLGTIVAAKTAKNGIAKGVQIMVGAPGKLFGIMPRLVGKVPVGLRRIMAGSTWGKKMLLIPMLRGNTGDKKGDDNKLLRSLSLTDVRALADTDYQKEIEIEMPEALSKCIDKNFVFIYGELDNQKDTNSRIKKYFTVPNAGHSPFGSHGKELMKVITGLELKKLSVGR